MTDTERIGKILERVNNDHCLPHRPYMKYEIIDGKLIISFKDDDKSKIKFFIEKIMNYANIYYDEGQIIFDEKEKGKFEILFK